MTKLSITLFVLLNVFVLINASTFVSFSPTPLDSNGNCQHTSRAIGLGYYVLVDYCFTLDGKYSHIISESGETYTHSYYNNNGGVGNAVCSGKPVSTTPIVESNCQSPISFNSYFSGLTSSFKVNVTTVSSTEIPWVDLPGNHYVNAYMKDYCDTEEGFILEYLSSGSQNAVAFNTDVTFTCENNEPYTQQCFQRSCNTAQNTNSTCALQGNTNENIYKTVYCSSSN